MSRVLVIVLLLIYYSISPVINGVFFETAPVINFIYVLMFFHLINIHIKMKYVFSIFGTVNKLIISYIALCLLSTLYNDVNIFKAFLVITLEFKFVVVLYYVYVIYHLGINEKEKEQLMLTLTLLVVVQFSFSLLQHFDIFGMKTKIVDLVFYDKNDYYIKVINQGGAFGTLLSKNNLAYFSLLTFLIFKFTFDKSNKIYYVVQILNAFNIMMSQSKSAMLMFVFFNILMMIRNNPSLRCSFSFFSFITLVLFYFILTPEWFSDYKKNIFEVGRVAYLFASLNEFISSPLLGIGAGNWGLGLNQFSGLEHNEIIATNGYFIPLGVFQDNNISSIMVQFGGVALVLLLSIYYVLLNINIKNESIERDLITMSFFIGSLIIPIFTSGIIMVTISVSLLFFNDKKIT